MIDKLIIKVKSGNGGKGSVSFNRDSKNSRGGPDGGNGGNGGKVLLKSNPNLEDLYRYNFQKTFSAENGQDGSKQNKSGAKGSDLVLDLPIGCLVWELIGNKRILVASILEDSQEIELLLGGVGGKGNTSFVSSQNKEPLLAEAGQTTSIKTLELDFRIFSDLLLIGPPNVGKSTFLSVVSNAKPEIKNYPFTTRKPVVAISKINYSNIKILELPAILDKKSLGMNFLKHIYGTKIICLTISVNENVEDQIKKVFDCIEAFDKELMKRNFLILLTKSEKLTTKQKDKISKQIMSKFLDIKVPPFFFSSGDAKEDIDILSYLQKNLEEFNDFTYEGLVPTISLQATTKKIKKIKNTYEILDKNFLQLADGSDLSNWKALVQFQYKLKNSKISKELKELGIQKGDKLKISSYEFTWEE